MARSDVMLVRDLKLPTIAGKFGRLLCMTGDHKGYSYYIKGQRVILGRGDGADIQILDEKVSREHAEITRISGEFIVTDLGSQNGILVNDNKVIQATLKDNDRLIIGKAVYKFNKVSIEDKPIIKKEEIKEVDLGKAKLKKKKGSRPLVFVLTAVLLFMLLFDTGQKVETETDIKKNTEQKVVDNRRKEVESTLLEAFDHYQKGDYRRAVASVESVRSTMNQVADSHVIEGIEQQITLKPDEADIKEKVDSGIQRGLREYREGNYFRAMSEFSFALTLDPGNVRAGFYMNKTKKVLDEEIQQNFNRARREISSLKYSSAIISYCAIMKLLQGYPNDSRYKDAQENINSLERVLGMEKDEIKCFEEQ